MAAMDFPNSPTNGQTTTDGRYYFDSSVGASGAWRSTPLPVGGLPAGSIMAWGTNTPPANWLLADGSAVSRATYSSLYAVIGTTYGTGDGTTTFNLPDLRGRVPVGRNGGTFGTLGATGGAETHTLDVTQIPSHTHKTFTQSIGAALTSGVNGTFVYNPGTGADSSATGGGGAHNNLQPYQVVNYIIKTSAGWTAGDSELATRIGAVETANATTNKSGLVPVIPTSIAVGSGSGSVSSAGVISFSGATTLSVNGCFSAAYENYFLVLDVTSRSLNAYSAYVLRSAGTDNRTSNYDRSTGWSTPTTMGSYMPTAQTEWFFAVNTFASGFFTTHINKPFLATPTTAQGQHTEVVSGTSNVIALDAGFHRQSLSFDGISVVNNNGNFTGTLRIYGLR